MSKLRFHVVHSSSEDPEYPATELNQHSPKTRGWQSRRLCEYPQELGFQLDYGETNVTQIQVLSHQSKIPTKVEIFVGQGRDYQTAVFKRLGYLSLDSNERSSYQARELKTVYVDRVGNFIKLVVHRCYKNEYNPFLQVAIVAVNFLGNDETQAGSKPTPREQYQLSKGSKGSGHSSNPLSDLSVDLNLDQGTIAKLKLLSEAKAKAVASEDYQTAKQIKVVEGELKDLGARLAQLDIVKRQAVEDEDYDRAAALKTETDSLRREIEDKIRSIQISGITDRPDRSTSPKISRRNEKMRPDNTGSKNGPPNVDDMPVGGLGVYRESVRDYSGGGAASGKKVVSAENVDLGSPRAAKLSARQLETEYDNHDDYDDMQDPDVYQSNDRPIKPKASSNYNDRDPEIEPFAKEESSSQSFPRGQHPLEGVPNLSELPSPEELKGVSKDTSDSGGITSLLGEYRASCLFSKVWALREAAVLKTRLLLSSDFKNTPGLVPALGPIASIIKVGVNDKIAQVFAASIALLDDIIANVTKEKIPRSTVAPLMDPILVSLIEKLADGTARIRDAAQQSIDSLAACSSVGCAHVVHHILRALPQKQKTAWRPILGRLQVLLDLVKVYGVGGSTGLDVQSILNFLKSIGAFTHSNGEVRDACKFLCISLHKYAGDDVLLPFLTTELRKNQLEEYKAAFKTSNIDNSHDDNDSQGESKIQMPSGQKSARGNEEKKSNEPKMNRNVQTTAEKSFNKDDPKIATVDGNNGGEDYTVCMFCGKKDKSWNEDGLDLHYWKECPLLSPCHACAQIVEIASLPEHLLDECEHKNEFEPCDTTGLAIRKVEMNAWKQSPNCNPPPDNCMYCPLCLASVEDTDEAWKQHLLYGCPKNLRSYTKR